MSRRLAPLFVLIVTLAVWAPVAFYDWTATWDDGAFILGNPHILSMDWRWMATTQWYGHWMPLTWLTFAANYALAGFSPASWHVVNVQFHAVSAVLLYFIARRLVGSTLGAVFAALLFAIHPLRMESVAWISERKDVVMGAFFLGAALLWLHNRRWWSFAAFVAACASKSPAVILPALLVVIEWYRMQRFNPKFSVRELWRFGLRIYVRPLWPFFAVSLIVSAMAFWSLHTILVSIPWSVVGLGPRLWQMAYSEVFYAAQTVWPARLSALIEYTWVPSWNQPQYPIALAACLVAALVCWRTRTRYPALLAVAATYTVAVLPQSGIFQNGTQLVANRYSYVACMPLALLAGGLFTMASRRFPRLSLLTTTAAVLALIVVTSVSLPMWKNGDAMWIYAAEHEPTCTQCQDMAAAADIRHGDFARALARQEQAVVYSATTMYPRWERHWSLAAILFHLNRRDEAAQQLRVYLASVPATMLHVDVDREHMERARAILAALEAQGH